MAIQIDVVVVVIDRVRKRVSFAHFVGMLVGSCFKDTTPPTFAKAKHVHRPPYKIRVV